MTPEQLSYLIAHLSNILRLTRKNWYINTLLKKDVNAIIAFLEKTPELDINAAVKNNFTLLTYACDLLAVELVTYLVTRPNINLNLRDSDGNTPLLIAARKLGGEHHEDALEIIKQLISANCDTSVANNDHVTALHLCTHSFEITNYLLSKNPTYLNKPTTHGDTPLHYAVATFKPLAPDERSINLLLKAEANYRHRNTNGLTAIECAILKEIRVDLIFLPYTYLSTKEFFMLCEFAVKQLKHQTAIDLLHSTHSRYHITNLEQLQKLTNLAAKYSATSLLTAINGIAPECIEENELAQKLLASENRGLIEETAKEMIAIDSNNPIYSPRTAKIVMAHKLTKFNRTNHQGVILDGKIDASSFFLKAANNLMTNQLIAFCYFSGTHWLAGRIKITSDQVFIYLHDSLGGIKVQIPDESDPESESENESESESEDVDMLSVSTDDSDDSDDDVTYSVAMLLKIIFTELPNAIVYLNPARIQHDGRSCSLITTETLLKMLDQDHYLPETAFDIDMCDFFDYCKKNIVKQELFTFKHDNNPKELISYQVYFIKPPLRLLRTMQSLNHKTDNELSFIYEAGLLKRIAAAESERELTINKKGQKIKDIVDKHSRPIEGKLTNQYIEDKLKKRYDKVRDYLLMNDAKTINNGITLFSLPQENKLEKENSHPNKTPKR